MICKEFCSPDSSIGIIAYSKCDGEVEMVEVLSKETPSHFTPFIEEDAIIILSERNLHFRKYSLDSR